MHNISKKKAQLPSLHGTFGTFGWKFSKEISREIQIGDLHMMFLCSPTPT